MSRNTNLKRVLDDAEGSSSSTPKRIKTITNLFNPNNVLTFACNNTSLNIVWEENDHQRNIKCFEAASKAYHNYNRHFKIVGFDESMKKAKQFLSLHGILPAKNLNGNEKIVSTNFDTNLINECFQITDLLNKRYNQHPFYIVPKEKDSSGYNQVLIPTGHLLLQTIAQTLHCAFFVFSTRSCPRLIKPYITQEERVENMHRRKPMPLYMILHHVDFFLPQNSCWDPLQFLNEPEDAVIKQNVFF